MMTLEDEAQEYVNKMALVDPIADVITEFVTESKWIQAEKIKAQLEIIREVLRESDLFDTLIIIKINSLEQQLKQLEDESKTN